MDKDQLLKPRLPEDTHDIDGVGTIRFRALSNGEAIRVSEVAATKNRQALILSLGLVEPALTVGEAHIWMQSAPAGEVDAVSKKIAAMSGMLEGAGKSGLPADGERPGG
jgi:hypothetical protein